ncbi:hypothetical protein RCL1_003781 [Eukaryota sp. TZLM3-RCL]
MNPYDILEIPFSAAPSEIAKAYRRLARDTHPDRFPNDPSAVSRFHQITEAYDTLMDPLKRSKYSAGLEAAAKKQHEYDTFIATRSVLKKNLQYKEEQARSKGQPPEKKLRIEDFEFGKVKSDQCIRVCVTWGLSDKSPSAEAVIRTLNRFGEVQLQSTTPTSFIFEFSDKTAAILAQKASLSIQNNPLKLQILTDITEQTNPLIEQLQQYSVEELESILTELCQERLKYSTSPL